MITPTVPRPDVAPPEAWAFPLPDESVTDNGIRLLSYAVPGQYVISVRLVVPLSLADEPADREGVAAMTARLLDEGTARHSSDEFAELMERTGMVLGASVTDGALTVDVDVPQRFLPAALDLMRQALAEPVFPEPEVRRILRSRLAEIEQERASAPHRGARELTANLWAPTERASRPTAGTPDSIGAMSRDDVVAFHRAHVGPLGATLVIAGDLADVDVAQVVTEGLGGWVNPDHVQATPARPPVATGGATRVVLVDRPGSVQSELSVAAPGPDRSIDTGWDPYPVLSFIVGGSPSARVDAVLREDKGYTYGIRASFRPRARGGSFITAGSVRADATVDALRLLVEILGEARNGFSDREIRAGVDYVVQTAPGRYATADAVADEASALAIEGLPLDFQTTTLTRMGELDNARLTTAYSDVVTGEWVIIVVGDAAELRDGIEALDLGPVKVVPN
ncbi:putative protease [Janibacter sp. HTCC2649]|uniref:M16 family metallopeptidase n=1 Tax=Janibacter sp. HTCC2649 TaxID=313589 RepID=UPI0000670A4F|nr:pitrilysin family protein [Janibacter sp. HTCC2649]EAP99955.1 putative protease [Janibacter sp. HTCC2649]